MSLYFLKYLPRFVPFFTALIIAFLEAVFFIHFKQDIFLISFLMGFIFYFSVFNSKNFNLFFVLFIGFVVDFLLFFPIGFETVLLITMSFFAYFFKRFISSLSFKGQWLIFSIDLAIIFIFAILLFSLSSEIPLPFLSLFLNYISIVIFYPFIASFCAFLNKKTGGV